MGIDITLLETLSRGVAFARSRPDFAARFAQEPQPAQETRVNSPLTTLNRLIDEGLISADLEPDDLNHDPRRGSMVYAFRLSDAGRSYLASAVAEATV